VVQIGPKLIKSLVNILFTCCFIFKHTGYHQTKAVAASRSKKKRAAPSSSRSLASIVFLLCLLEGVGHTPRYNHIAVPDLYCEGF
tara:strand:+ start:38 stop:292 length:255 start_codon:yes stop_codon:yes gene_type:complete